MSQILVEITKNSKVDFKFSLIYMQCNLFRIELFIASLFNDSRASVEFDIDLIPEKEFQLLCADFKKTLKI